MMSWFDAAADQTYHLNVLNRGCALFAESISITQTKQNFIHQHQSADDYSYRSALCLSKNRC